MDLIVLMLCIFFYYLQNSIFGPFMFLFLSLWVYGSLIDVLPVLAGSRCHLSFIMDPKKFLKKQYQFGIFK